MADYQYPSEIRNKLASAHDELIEVGFLRAVEWTKNKKGETMVSYVFDAARVASGVTSGADAPTVMPFAGPRTVETRSGKGSVAAIARSSRATGNAITRLNFPGYTD